MIPARVVMLSDKTKRIGSFGPFGRFRVTGAHTIFDSKQIFDSNPLFFENELLGGGSASYNSNHACTDLMVGTAPGDLAARQSRRYFNYQPGKGQLVFVTFNMLETKANLRERVGYFDANDGLFIERTDSGVRIVRRTSTSGTPSDSDFVSQENWNIDRFDGTGPSKVNLDFTKTQILAIDLQWLGTGAVRFGFDVGGNVHYAHESLHANTLTTVYMRTPNLPVRWEIENTGTTVSASQLDAICCSVMSEGGVEHVGTIRSADNDESSTVIGSSLKPLISIRLKPSHNRATVIPRTLNVMTTSKADFHWKFILNPVVGAGAGQSWNSVPDSAVEYDIQDDGVLSAGHVLGSGFVSNNANAGLDVLSSQLMLASSIAGVSDIMTLAVRSLSVNETFYGAINWMEVA